MKTRIGKYNTFLCLFGLMAFNGIKNITEEKLLNKSYLKVKLSELD